MTDQDELRILQRIAQGIERLGPPPEPKIDVKNADAFIWDAEHKDLIPVAETHHLDLKLLKRRTGALKVSARDSVTGAPIPYAQVYEGSSCMNFCE